MKEIEEAVKDRAWTEMIGRLKEFARYGWVSLNDDLRKEAFLAIPVLIEQLEKYEAKVKMLEAEMKVRYDCELG